MPDALGPFSTWIAKHARGTLDDDITAALADVVEKVNDLDSKGEVVIKLKVIPAGSGKRTVVIAGEVDAKPPKPAPEVGLFYVGDAGSLHLEDPFQTRIDVSDARHVDPTTGKPTTPNGETDA